jgi:diguanylate cyclase (GGDEF)-like protein/PAS domain S-box-containing protein
MSVSLLLIDSNASLVQSVATALSLWNVRAVDTPEQARGQLASQVFDAALVAEPWVAEEAAACDTLALLRGIPALAIVPAGGEAQAAYALRHGFDDFVVQDAQGAWLGGLARQIESVLSRLRERRSMQAELARMDALLAEKTRALEVTLASVSQGIANFDADGRIRVHNQRMLELLELPPELFEGEPNMERLVRFQTERGDFGPDFSLIDDPHARNYVMQEYAVGEERKQWPEQYLRRTPSGRYIEIRTRTLKGGGRVRTFSDVTDYIMAQEALRRSEARWRSLTQLSSDWFWEQDAQFRFVHFDGSVTHQIVPIQMSYGHARWEIPHRNVTEAQWQAHRAQLEAHEEFRDFELERTAPDGSSIWASVSGAPMFDAQGRFTGYQGVARDITERKRAEAEIQHLAFYDELTGLPNRRLLLDRLEQAALAHAREGRHGALIFLDLDNFKAINDTMGHEWGDRLLVQVAGRLVACVRPSDNVARLGGDEFVVVLQHLPADAAEAARQTESMARKVLAALNQPYDVRDRIMHSTSSLGITLFGGAQGPGATVAELLQRADLAMYQAKSSGRNTLCFFDQAMQAAATERLALEADIRNGLERGEFLLHYQRVVDATGATLGAEALVRWQHPKRGLVLPGEFIAVAEQSGQILPLGRFVLRAACEQLAQWAHDEARQRWTLSVNVSAQEFRHPGFVQQVLGALDETGADPHRLKLELTESTLLHEVEDSIARMQALRNWGVGLSLDDFGTGYSSLAYLKRLPIQQLKIDQSFVRDVLTDPNDAAIACTVVDLARSLGLDVVAEGVESEGQLDFLLANGCKRFQGYLFGRPGPAQALL